METTPEKQLTNLFEYHLKVRPRSLTVKIERAIREHPTYWGTRLLLTAKEYDIYDKVLFSPKDNDGYLIFACHETVQEDITTVDYHVLHFRYTDPNFFGLVSVSFTAPYLATTSSKLVLKKPLADREDSTEDYEPKRIVI